MNKVSGFAFHASPIDFMEAGLVNFFTYIIFIYFEPIFALFTAIFVRIETIYI